MSKKYDKSELRKAMVYYNPTRNSIVNLHVGETASCERRYGREIY